MHSSRRRPTTPITFDTVDATLDEMETRWYDSAHTMTEAEKMVEDYNNGLTILNENQSFAAIDMAQAAAM